MALARHGLDFGRISQFRPSKRAQTWGLALLVALGPVLAIATFVVLGPLGEGGNGAALRLVLLTDLIYVLVIAAAVIVRVAQMVAARRARSAGSRLHLRLALVFGLVALLPTVLVAVFAVLTVNTGLEGWFSDRVQRVIGASLAAAEAYEADERNDLANDALTIARVLNGERAARGLVSDQAFDGDVRQLLAQVEPRIQRGIKESFVLDGMGRIMARGPRSYEFDFERPTERHFDTLLTEDVLIVEDWDNDEFRALIRLGAFTDRYLYVSRTVDGSILTLLDETQETARLYSQLEDERGRLLFDFGLLYLGFAVTIILATTWLGLWFAERLSRPVGRLTGAAQRVGAGDLNVRVPDEPGDDEIAMLGRYFNQMTEQLRGQRQSLLNTTEQIERRRRLFDSVLSSVTSGVIGLDAQGRTTFVNRSAARALALEEVEGRPLAEAVPEFAPLFETLRRGRKAVAQEELRVARGGKNEILLVRMAVRKSDTGKREGYVVAFEDVTDLVSAQRMAAWGDVARRIAHEIKNPLTPIQLSAERIKRKFGPKLGEESDMLEAMTDVIVRQTNDLRRIVDEFSKFARMPAPKLAPVDLGALLRGAVLLQEAAHEDIAYGTDLPRQPVMVMADETMISQALTNLLKNAAEAIGSRAETGDPHPKRVHAVLEVADGAAHLTIDDTGIGLPEDRMRLFEPYVTRREEGTGLGLSIVLKIVEEHGGTLSLDDAPPDEAGHRGARADLRLPLATTQPRDHQEEAV
ncbi:MAG: ATP-binding protein [Shimia sp.]